MTSSTPMPADAVSLLRTMMVIRALEEALAQLPRPGFQLYSSGEEAVGVGVAAALDRQDQLLTSGRSIGPALGRGLAPVAVLGELLGKVTGPCRGKGGRGHLSAPAAGFFGAHAVVGGNLTIAAGVALALKRQAARGVAMCLFGDGACGAGALHETINIAALWQLPLVLVCANNQYSVSTPIRAAVAAEPLAALAAPFRIPAQTVDGMDVLAVHAAVQELVERARAGGGPGFLECITYRFCSHSNAVKDSRSAAEVATWQERCPIRSLTTRLTATGQLDADSHRQLEAEVRAEIAAAITAAITAAYPDPVTEVLADVG